MKRWLLRRYGKKRANKVRDRRKQKKRSQRRGLKRWKLSSWNKPQSKSEHFWLQDSVKQAQRLQPKTWQAAVKSTQCFRVKRSQPFSVFAISGTSRMRRKCSKKESWSSSTRLEPLFMGQQTSSQVQPIRTQVMHSFWCGSSARKHQREMMKETRSF